MKLRLPLPLFRAVMACFAAFMVTSLATASSAASTAVDVQLAAPDVEQQEGTMTCWAASAADILSLETGRDARAIYRSLTDASGNTAGYVESALSWYQAGAQGKLDPLAYDARHAAVRSGFGSLASLAEALEEALGTSPAVSLSLQPRSGGLGHALTVYACRYGDGRLELTFADPADGVQGLRRAEVVATPSGLLLAGTEELVASLAYLGEEAEPAQAPAAPVGAYMHSMPLLQEYTDLAENRGVYRFGYMPSAIMYRNGQPTYSLAVTPDYHSVADMGCYTLVDNGSYQITVNHNGMMSTTFNSRFIGSNAQHYSTIGIRGSNMFVYGAGNPFVPTHDDYKLDRISRLVTDSPSSAYCTDIDLMRNIGGVMHYRVGGGTSGRFDSDGNIIGLVGAWGYGLTAGIAVLGEGYYTDSTGVSGVGSALGDTADRYTTCLPGYPLPSVPQAGDSGSPVFIYNAETERFELVGVLQGGSTANWGTRYNYTATVATFDLLNTEVSTTCNFNEADAEATTYYIHGAHVGENDQLVEDDFAAAYLRKGVVTLGKEGTLVAEYNGVALDEFAAGTWKPLADPDRLDWYTVDDRDLLNAAYNKGTDADTFGVDDLFYTNNLLFMADSADGSDTAYRRIELAEDVDLGIGRVQFSLGQYKKPDGSMATLSSATFDIGRESSDFFLSSAGFVVEKGVTVNNYFTYGAGRELRVVGEGTLNIVGEGKNEVLLNIGGGGTTYLNRTGGYGAYSALVNNKAVLKLADTGQVHNNVALGANGGVLDFNGNDYRWTSGGAHAQGSDGKEYFGLTVYGGLDRVEESYVVNYATGTASTITIERGDDFEFAGAFRDGSHYSTTANGKEQTWDSRYTMMPSLLINQYTQFTESQRQDSGSVLRVVYDGHATMTMTGVYTMLTGSNAEGESGFEVASGKVQLRGTNTIHALGSESGVNHNRWQNPRDWHYAMAEMDVKVASGAAFELGDHALLIGNVQVESGATFTMKQAVNERYEFVEGWYEAEDTYALAAYYGLKGDVSLAEGALMDIRFDEGVATRLNYGGSISGAGSLRVDVGSGSVLLDGRNSFAGEKTLVSGSLHLAEGAEGDTSRNKWRVEDKGVLALDAVKTTQDVYRLVHEESTGVLALSSDFREQVAPGYFPGLIIGAAEGMSVHYGSAELLLKAVNNSWTLGGGGGTLYVDFLLADNADGTANKLILGNEHGFGTVVLTNAANSFSGGIDIVGKVMLEFTDVGALGDNRVSVGYGSALGVPHGVLLGTGKLDAASDGVLALTAEGGAGDYDLSQHQQLALGAKDEATLTGHITVAEGAAYRFGGSGVLTLATELSGDGRSIVIDGQGTAGSRVVLARASAATGSVTVQGYDPQRASSGDATLSFTVDDALLAAPQLLLQNGGMVDLNGTNQVFNNVVGDAGSLIYDRSSGGNSLTLHYTEAGSYAGSIEAAGTDVVKTGTGTLTLGGTNLWKSFSVAEGVVEISNGKSLGYIASGSQDINVNVRTGATLHVTQGTTFDTTLNIAGAGSAETPYALIVSSGTLNNKLSALNVMENAAIAGNYAFKVVNLKGNTLRVDGTPDSPATFNPSDIKGGNGHLILDNAHMEALVGRDYSLDLLAGSYVSIDRYTQNNNINVLLDGGTFYMSRHADVHDANQENGSVFYGDVTLGAGGGTFSNYSSNDGKELSLMGAIHGTHADSTLVFSSREQVVAGSVRSIKVGGMLTLAGNASVLGATELKLSGPADIAGTLAVEGAASVLIGGKAHVGTLSGVTTQQRSDSSEDGGPQMVTTYGRVALDAGGELHLHGGSEAFTFGGTLDVTQGSLFLHGNEGGTSLGHVGTLEVAAAGQLVIGNLAAYLDGAEAMLQLGSVVGEGGIRLSSGDLDSLEAGTYRLLSASSELGSWSLLNSLDENSRLKLELVSGGTEGAYTLNLVVSGQHADVTWQGTGTLLANTANAVNISGPSDNMFQALDRLFIDSAQGATETLTLGGAVNASSVTFKGAGTTILAQVGNSGFAPGSTFTLNGTGTLELGSTTAITGELLMQQGTLSANAAALNAMAGITVTGADTTLSVTDATRVGTHIAISQGGKLLVTGASAQNDRTFAGGFSGSGTLEVDSGKGVIYLTGDSSAFTGAVHVTGGTLGIGIQKNTAVSFGAGSITMADGTTLQLNAPSMTLGADITWGEGANLRVADGSSSYILSGRHTLNGALNIYNSWGKSVLISGPIEGAGSLNFLPGGSESPSYTLSGQNTYSGGTVINRANLTVYATHAQSLGTGAITLKQGVLSWMDAGGKVWDGDLVAPIVLAGEKNLAYGAYAYLNTNGYDVRYSQAVSGAGMLNKNGLGTLTLSGELSYSGATNVLEGTLALESSLAAGSAGVTVYGGAELRLGGAHLNGHAVGFKATGTSLAAALVSGSVQDLNSAASYNAEGSTGMLSFTDGGLFTASLGGSQGGVIALRSPEALTVGSTISGDVMLNLQGDVTLMGENSYTCGTELLAGSLTVGSHSALGTGALLAHSGSSVTIAEGVNALIGGESTVDSLIFGEGSSVSVGAQGNAGKLTLGSISGAARFELDIYGADSYDRLAGSLGADTQLTLKLHSGTTTGSYLLVEGSAAFDPTAQVTFSGAAHDSGAYTYTWHKDQGLTLDIDYNRATTNIWSGGSGAWGDASGWNDGAGFNGQYANTLFRVAQGGNHEVAVSSAAETTTLIAEVAKDAALSFGLESSLKASTLVKEGEGRLTLTAGAGSASFGKVEVNGGTLSANGMAALGTKLVSGSGTLELTGAMQARGDELTISNIVLRGEGASLDVSDGQAWTSLEDRNILVDGGAELKLGYWSGFSNTALTLKDGGRLVLGAAGFAQTSIAIDGAGTLAIGRTTDYDDGGTLILATPISGTGTLTLADYTEKHATPYAALFTQTISDSTGGKLALSTSLADLHLSAANTYSGGTSITGGQVTAEHASALGTGMLTMQGGGLVLGADLELGGLTGTGGTLSLGSHTLTINQAEAGTYSGTITGEGALVKRGEGSLDLAGTAEAPLHLASLRVEQGALAVGALDISQKLVMTVGAEASLHIDSLTLADGATLAYHGTGLATVAQVAAGASLTLDLDRVANILLQKQGDAYTSYDLGLDLADVKLSVKGLADTEYLISRGENGHSYITLVGEGSWGGVFVPVSWDAAWGIAEPPALVRTVAVAGTEFVLADEGSLFHISGTEGEGAAAITGSKGNAAGADFWLDIAAGTFGDVVMGAKAGQFAGDTHLQATGGSFANIMGGNLFTTGTSFSGDSYVSLSGTAEVEGMLLGGSY